MKSSIRSLAIVSSVSECKNVLKMDKGAVFIATSLEAEYYLEKTLPNYKNLLYEFILKSKYYKFRPRVFRNFKIAYDFCDNNLQYIRDRFAYFLLEFERSFDFVVEIIDKYHPDFLFIGKIKSYPGASVVDGNLKMTAFYIVAKQKNIPFYVLDKKVQVYSLRQFIGEKIQRFRYRTKQNIVDQCDVLVLATPKHIINMAATIKNLQSSNLRTAILTYNLTLSLKKELDKTGLPYYEKERVINSKIINKSKKARISLVKKKPWNKLRLVKYENYPEIISFIRSKLNNIVKDEMLEVFNDIFLANEIVKKLRPKALVVTTDPDSKILPYINTVKAIGRKSICIQHGAFNSKDTPAIIPTSDFFIAWSNLSKRLLVKNGYFQKIKVFDANSPFHNYKKKKTFLLKHQKPRILYLVTKHGTVEKGIIMFFLKELFKTLNGMKIKPQVFIRVHPFQDMSNFVAIKEAYGDNIAFANTNSLEDEISKSDIVIFENTTAGFDAMLLAKPTIYFNPYTGDDSFNIGSSGPLMVLDLNDLKTKLPKFIFDIKQQSKSSMHGKKFAEQYLGLTNSSIKIVDIINSLVKT